MNNYEELQEVFGFNSIEIRDDGTVWIDFGRKFEKLHREQLTHEWLIKEYEGNWKTPVTTKDVKEVAKFWGDKMPLMACEEMGELIQAISKYERSVDHIDIEINKMKIEKEIADVVISMYALCEYYKIDPENLNKAVDAKLAKKYEDPWEKWKKTLVWPTEFERRTENV